jgi:hypothetical protein
MKNKINLWKPIDFLNGILSEYANNVAKLYRLRFRNWRLKMKIKQAKELTKHDRKKRWIIYGHDYKMYLITRKNINNLKENGILKDTTTFVDLDYSALRIITFQNQMVHVNFSKTKQTNKQ